MGIAYNTSMVRNGLVLHLDAANPKSYPGSGTTWYDLSSGKRNYSFSTGVAWNSAGYFNFTGGTMTGPASNLFNFFSTVEHTIIAFAKITSQSSNNFFKWTATPIVGTDTRAIMTHFPFGGGTFYYDVAGCCGADQRISSATADDFFIDKIGMATWRTRKNQTPNRQFFNNLTSVLDSGANSTASVNWNLTDAATIGNGWYGELYTFIVYNRALTDQELQVNFEAYRGRYGL